MKKDVAVALVSDFFYPSLGGVEVHIKEMSGILRERVRKVIVITHCYQYSYCISLTQSYPCLLTINDSISWKLQLRLLARIP